MSTIWKLHGDGKKISAGDVVSTDERLSWPRTIGIGVQHIAAMFGATFLVPALTGFPATTTLFFSGIGTILFLIITKNRVPSYLGSSFAFLGPIFAAKGAEGGGISYALGGIIFAGVVLMLVGVLVQSFGIGWVNALMPPVVTGAIVLVIGLNLAGAARRNFQGKIQDAATLAETTVDQHATLIGVITLVAIALIAAISKGIIGRISVFLGLVVGYAVAAFLGYVNTEDKIDEAGNVIEVGMKNADWVAIPDFQTPQFKFSIMILFLPVVLVLIAENVGHVKAVAAMTGKSLDDQMGNALLADGAATTLAGMGGGSGTTTYAENIGVMAASRVYSTAAYWVAGFGAILLSLSPKFGAVLAATPMGALGGAGTALFGMIGVLGARIWIEGKADFANPINLLVVASSLIIGIADYSWTKGDYTFTGIVNATVVAIVGYHLLHALAKIRK
jgi:NCS2 family nucleobase:cation symporter-2